MWHFVFKLKDKYNSSNLCQCKWQANESRWKIFKWSILKYLNKNQTRPNRISKNLKWTRDSHSFWRVKPNFLEDQSTLLTRSRKPISNFTHCTRSFCLFFQFFISALSFATFAVSPELPQNRLQLSFTLLLTSVAFKFVINQSLPKISYLTYMVSW